MKITFLGTGAGRPSSMRNTSSTFIEFNRKCVLIDAGEGCQMQLHKAGIRVNRIDYIFITHNHGDHIYGLFGLLNTMSIEGRGKKDVLSIICDNEMKKTILSILKMTHSYLSFEIAFILPENVVKLPISDEVYVDSCPLIHEDINCFAFRFTLSKDNISISKLKEHGLQPGPIIGELTANGYIISDEKRISLEDVSDSTFKTYVFAGDNNIKLMKKKGWSEFLSFCKNAESLVHEGTLLNDEDGHIDGHSYASDVVAFANESNVKHLILNHISSRYSKKDVAEARNSLQLPDMKLDIASDFDMYNFK